MAKQTQQNIAGIEYPNESDSKSTLFEKARNILRVLLDHDHTPGKGAPLGEGSGGVPTGLIGFWPGDEAPDGWLIMNNQEVSSAQYPALSKWCGNRYNDGTEASGNFRLPKVVGRSVLVAGSASGLTTRTLAATGGAETVTLAEANVPGHTHAQQGTFTSTTESVSGTHHHPAPHGGFFDSDNGGGFSAVSGGTIKFSLDSNTGDAGPPSHQHNVTLSGNTGTGSGSGSAVDKMPPFIALNAIIKT